MQSQPPSLNNGSLHLDKNDLVDIYEQYSPRLYRYALRLLGDPELAEDCVSETFSRFLQAIQKGGGPKSNLQAYLYRVAHNWIMDYYRNRPAQEELQPEMADDNLVSPLVQVTDNIQKEIVRNALFHLTPEQRQVIMLRFYENWSHEEIAKLIGKTAQATRALQHRALEALHRMLVEREDEFNE